MALIPQMDAVEIIQLCTEIHLAEEEQDGKSLQRLEQQQPGPSSQPQCCARGPASFRVCTPGSSPLQCFLEDTKCRTLS